MKIKNLNPLYEYNSDGDMTFRQHAKRLAKVPVAAAKNAYNEFGPDMKTAKRKGAVAALGPLGAVLSAITSDINIPRNSDPLYNRISQK